MFGSSHLLCARKARNNIKKKTFTYSEKSAEQRQEYLDEIAGIPEEELVYVDEMGLSQYLQREKGRALRGQKIYDIRPGRRFKRVNIIGCIAGGKHMATEQYEHTTTAGFFEDWFEHELLPHVPNGHTVIMDNARFHRKTQLHILAAKAGVRLIFLPPYSPDLNPIEHAWANLKRWLRDNMAYWGCPMLAVNEYFWWNDWVDYY